MPHRNICRGGLDGFVDVKDAVNCDSGLTRGLHQSVRKVPADVRWFSESSVMKEEMHRKSLDVVLAASAKKPAIEIPDGDVSSAVLKTSSTAIPHNDVKQVASQSRGAKRKQTDTVECGGTIQHTRRQKSDDLKGKQGSPTARMNEQNIGKNSQSLPSKDKVIGKTNDLQDTRDKKDDSKKVEQQRRRRSRRGAKP